LIAEGDKMKKALVIFLCLGLVGFVTILAVAGENEGYVAKFDYTTPLEEAPNSADVTVMIASAFYKTNNGIHWFASPQFANLSESIQEDLLKVVTAKGLNVRGPYESYDLIPFQDKKAIDLILLPIVELSVTLKDHKEKAENMWMPAADQIQTGNAVISGKFILQMKEIATGELMWVKTIPFKSFEFPYYIRVTYEEYAHNKTHTPGQLYSYNPIFDGMASGIEQQYPDILGTIDRLIDPEEMQIIKKQAQELKTKRGY